MSTSVGTTSNLSAIQEQYETIAHNLANVSTPGYKRRFTTFSQALAQQVGHLPAAAAGGPIRTGTAIDFSPAQPVQTGRSLDLFLNGNGFFTVDTDKGPLYTRNGCFRTNAQGQLVTSTSQLVAGQNGPITVPSGASAERLRVTQEGSVYAGATSIGKLRIVSFPPEVTLQSVGGNCLQAPADANPDDDPKTQVVQGCYESSNVSAVEELVSLVTVTRLYEANLKTIQTQDQKNQTLFRAAGL